MEIFLWWVFITIFLYINYIIIKTDIDKKRIPNKHLLQLLYLLPFWILFSIIVLDYRFIHEINQTLTWFCITLILVILLYGFKIWWAWDSKYFFVLASFVLYTEIIYLFAAIWIIFILHIILNSFTFWYKQVIHYEKLLRLIQNIKNKELDAVKYRIWELQKSKVIIQIFFYFIKLLLVFTVIRIVILFGIEVYNYDMNHSYLYGLLVVIIVIVYLLIKRNKYIVLIFHPKLRKNYYYIPLLYIILLVEYIVLWDIFFEKIKIAFIYYFPIFIIIKLILSGVLLSIDYQDNIKIKVSNLKPWMIINRKLLSQDISTEYYITKNDIKKIKNAWLKEVVIIKEFWYSPYIFSWFILYILWLIIIKNI